MAFKNARRRLRHPLRKARAAEQAVLVDITTDGETISSEAIIEALRPVIGERVYLRVADREYASLSRPVLEAFLRRDGTDRYPYTAEGGDCDDFAHILKGRVCEAQMRASAGRAVVLGIAHGRFQLGDASELTEMHAMCFALLNGGELVLLEPQTDGIYPFTAESKVVFLEF